MKWNEGSNRYAVAVYATIIDFVEKECENY